MKTWRIRLFNWEYWSFAMVYSWIFPVWFLLCLRAKSFFFFSTANPTIKNGGFLNESKKDIYSLIPDNLSPRTLHFKSGDDPQQALQLLNDKGLYFPLIGKPDIGGRGRGVKVLELEEEVIGYFNTTKVDFHIQEFISYPNEVGIFYYRMPGETKGKISGIVGKEFLSVTGDGVHTIKAILKKNKRAIMYMDDLEKMYGEYLDTILRTHEKKLLVPIGNHARGAKFLDHSSLIDQQLTDTVDKICRQIDQFYYGRLDIRYNNWEELKQGKNFCIIEVNGAGAEPTHMYDPSHNLFFAWKEIIRHWIILNKISRANHKIGYKYLSFKEGLKMFKEDKLHSQKLAEMPV